MSMDGSRLDGRALWSESSDLGSFSRRRFIKTALAAAAATQLPSWARPLYGQALLTEPPLILYDGRGEFAWVARLHAKMLANLLGRFLPLDARVNPVIRQRVERYQRGDIERHPITFYIGNTFGNPLPRAFRDDVLATYRTVVWLKYNLDQIAWTDDRTAWNPTFLDRFGFAFRENRIDVYETVSYLGESYTKFQDVPLPGGILGSEIGLTEKLPSSPAEIKATIEAAPGGEAWPYVIRGGNFWYVADLPFSFMSEEDRYLVFADLLFGMLGVSFPPMKRALIRIEDVSAVSAPAELRAVADLLAAEEIPFAVSVIPLHRDPYGILTGGEPARTPIYAATDVVDALNYMVERGGEIVMHGLTHQLWKMLNPYNALSSHDYEFFRVTENPDEKTLNFLGPLRFDSRQWARGRLRRGKAILHRAGLDPFAFEVPHYAASETDFKVFAREFPLNYHRAMYFTYQGKKCKPHPCGKSTRCPPRELKWAGQFFPYPIVRDVYRQKLLPENLGALNPEAWPDPELGPHPKRLPEDIIRAARKNAVLRDAWASFYANATDIELIKETVAGVRALGFEFVRPSEVEV